MQSFFDWVHAVYGFVWPARAISAVLPSVTRLGASALEAARFAVSALEAARFAVPTCQPSGHTQRELRILASAPSAERPIPWPSNFT